MNKLDLEKDWITQTAEALIIKHNLRNTHGEVICWKCNGRPATMPTLHCINCLAEHRQRNGSK